MTDLLTEKNLAAQLGLNHLTLRNWRSQGRGPAAIRLSHNCVRYRQCDVDLWLAGQGTRPESQHKLRSGYVADPKKVLEIAYGVFAALRLARGEDTDRKHGGYLGAAVDELLDWSL